MEQKNLNIWEEALAEKAKEPSQTSLERLLIVVGNRSSGKSSFIKLMKNEANESQPKPTYLMEYSFIKRGFNKKELIHCYEFSSKSQLDLLSSLFSKDVFGFVTIAICVDLQRPSKVIEEVSSWVEAVKLEMEMVIQEKIGLQEKANEWLLKRKDQLSSHEDYTKISLPPLNIVLVGCKYDLFEKYQTENRKWLSRAMRFLAHSNYCSLIFSAKSNAALGTQVRSFLTEAMFEEKPKVVTQKDHLKPIIVYRGQDTFGSIGVPAQGAVSGIEVLRRQLGGLFGQEEQKKREGVDPAKYAESKVDALLEERKKQLAKISKGRKQL